MDRRVLVVLCCWLCCVGCVGASARTLLAPSQSAGCGAPGAICGSAVSAKTCPQGPGYCQKGYFCGAPKRPPSNQPLNLTDVNPDKPPELRCLPVPADCGKEGQPCCPSNAVTPHTQPSDVFRPATCNAEGLVCFEPSQHHNQPFYQGNTGDRPCTFVAPDCGSAAGRPCCPSLWRTSTNPDIRQGRDSHCWGKGPAGKGLFCDYKQKDSRVFQFGTCVANKPNCGTFGNECCQKSTDFGPQYSCEGPNGAKGYCAPADGAAATKGESIQMCKPCLDAQTVAANKGPWQCMPAATPPPSNPQRLPQGPLAHPVPVNTPVQG